MPFSLHSYVSLSFLFPLSLSLPPPVFCLCDLFILLLLLLFFSCLQGHMDTILVRRVCVMLAIVQCWNGGSFECPNYVVGRHFNNLSLPPSLSIHPYSSFLQL